MLQDNDPAGSRGSHDLSREASNSLVVTEISIITRLTTIQVTASWNIG